MLSIGNQAYFSGAYETYYGVVDPIALDRQLGKHFKSADSRVRIS
jgi:hypothetical protein